MLEDIKNAVERFSETTIADGDWFFIIKKEFVDGVLDYEAYLDMSGNVPYLYYKNNGWVKEEYPKEEDNSINNLALLPKNANSSLNNKLFNGKRDKIRDWAPPG